MVALIMNIDYGVSVVKTFIGDSGDTYESINAKAREALVEMKANNDERIGCNQLIETYNTLEEAFVEYAKSVGYEKYLAGIAKRMESSELAEKGILLKGVHREYEYWWVGVGNSVIPKVHKQRLIDFAWCKMGEKREEGHDEGGLYCSYYDYTSRTKFYYRGGWRLKQTEELIA